MAKSQKSKQLRRHKTKERLRGKRGKGKKKQGEREEEKKWLGTQHQENCKDTLHRQRKQRKRRKEINILPKAISW